MHGVSGDFDKVSVVVERDGEEVDVEVRQLAGGYGNAPAIAITPVGWQIEAGSTYGVTVDYEGPTISYEFEAVDCGE